MDTDDRPIAPQPPGQPAQGPADPGRSYRPGPLAPNPAPGPGEFFGSARTAEADAAAPALRRRHPRRRLVAGLTTSGAAALATTLVFVLGGGKSTEAAVIDSVNSTMADRTAHVTMDLAVDSPKATVSGTGSGGIDFSQNSMEAQMTIGVGGQHIPIQAVYVAGSVYEKFPGLDQLVPGKSWISLDFNSLGAANSQNLGAFGTGNNPTAMLRLLAQQGNTVVPLGASAIDGTSVQGYSVQLNAAAIKAELAQAHLPSWMSDALSRVDIQGISNKVYVDSSGLLRRYTMKLTEVVASSGSVTINESLGFSDYGTPVDVSAPPPDQVVSFGEFIRNALAGSG